MSYSYDKFLRPLTESDVTIKILDNNNDIKYTIDPFVIISVSISNNVLKITLKSKSILIDFSSINETKLALIRIQDQIDTLVQKVPNRIDKQTENYIENYVDYRFTDVITDIIPSQDSTYNLGSSASQWKSLHVSGHTIYIGGVTLSTDGQSLVVNSINLGTIEFPLILSAGQGNLLLNGTGSFGATGATGIQGPQGPTGVDGPIGPTGGDGLQGPIGPTGADGLQGPIGPTGADGLQGPIGPTGADGILNLTFSSIVNTLGYTPSNDSNVVHLTGTETISGAKTFNNTIRLNTIVENINTITAATASKVTYDFSTGSIWYHSTASTNYTANFINIPTTDETTVTSTIIISQGATGYSPNVVQISGVTQSIKWAAGTYSVSTNKVDIVGFTFIRSSSTWVQVLGQISSFS